MPDISEFKKAVLPWPKRALVFSIIFAVIVGGFYFGIRQFNLSIKNQIENIKQQINDSVNSLPEDRRVEIFKMDARVTNLEQILNNHIYSSRTFGLIEKLVHPKVSFKTMDVGSDQNIIALTGIADSYNSLAEQIVGAYSVDGIKKVNLKSFGADEKGVSFSLDINFDPKLIK